MTPKHDHAHASSEDAIASSMQPEQRHGIFFSAEYLLALSPLMLLSTSALKGLTLGVTTSLLLIVSAALNYWIFGATFFAGDITIFRRSEISLKAVIIAVEFFVAAIFASCAQLILSAYQFPLFQSVGWIAPVIALHTWLTVIRLRQNNHSPNFTCVIKAPAKISFKIVALLLCLGAFIEVVHARTLFGYAAGFPSLFVFTPAATWLLLAVILAVSKRIFPTDISTVPSTTTPSGHKRVRTTGHIK